MGFTEEELAQSVAIAAAQVETGNGAYLFTPEL